MTIWGVLAIIFLVATIWLIIAGIVNGWYDDWIMWLLIASASLLIIFVSVLICNVVELKKEQVRQTKEREQILYQVEHLSEGKEKTKLNEWILTYNDWVNDINTEKETFGWFAWHSNFDMSKHQTIDLV